MWSTGKFYRHVSPDDSSGGVVITQRSIVKNIRRVAVVFVLSMTIQHCLAAGPRSNGTDSGDPEHMVMDLTQAQLQLLFDWIDENTNYPAIHPLPLLCDIESVEVGETITYEGRPYLIPPELRAAYDHETKKVYIVQPWSAGNLKDMAILLHELVHHRQFTSECWACPQATEWDAYKLQERWLAERGVDAQLDWFLILMLSSCPRDVHP